MGPYLHISILLLVILLFLPSRLSSDIPLSMPCGIETPPNQDIVPEGALWRKETLHFLSPPEGFHTFVGWINAATISPCAESTTPPPTIEIHSLKIITIGPGENDIASQEIPLLDSEHFVGRLFPRFPQWFDQTQGWSETNILRENNGDLLIDLSTVPLRVYHAWSNPRTMVGPDQKTFLEAEVRITGTARLQLGLDYWRDETVDYNGYDIHCIQSNNCEAWVSDWFSNTGGEMISLTVPFTLSPFQSKKGGLKTQE